LQKAHLTNAIHHTYFLWLCISFTPFAYSQTGTTGKPIEWVQIGQTQDLVLQLDANSLLGYEGANGLPVHRADFRYKGKTDERLTTKTKTAFMLQTDCDAQRGVISILPTNAEGQPTGNGEDFNFDLAGETKPDAIARAMCKARQITIENQILQKEPPKSSVDPASRQGKASGASGRSSASAAGAAPRGFPDPKVEVWFEENGRLSKNLLLKDRDGVPYYGCSGNMSERFQEYIYQSLLEIARAADIKDPPRAVCSINGSKFDNVIMLNINFYASKQRFRDCVIDRLNCEPYTVTSMGMGVEKAMLFVSDLAKLKQAIGCLDMTTGDLFVSENDCQ
jgi:hypothetical protein